METRIIESRRREGRVALHSVARAGHRAAVGGDQGLRQRPQQRRCAARALAATGAGSFTAVMGPSGSGKSTFLHCAAGLDRPTSGTIHLGDVDLGGLGEDALSRLRRERVGFVFQAFNLVPSLTAAQNITLPLRLAKRKPTRPGSTR